MKSFIELIIEAIESQKLVSGPGIDLLRAAMKYMRSRGEPTTINDIGFNKGDWEAYTRIYSNYVDNPNIPVDVVVKMLNTARVYKNTQLRNFPEIERLVRADLQDILSDENKGAIEKHEDSVVIFPKEMQYGKVSVYIPGFDRSLQIKINKLLRESMEKKGYQRVVDQFGNNDFEIFKIFSKNKSKPGFFWIHTGFLEQIIKLLENNGKTVVTFEEEAPKPVAEVIPDPIEPRAERSLIDLEIIGKNETGKKLKVKFGGHVNGLPKAIREQGLSGVGFSFDASDGLALINVADESIFDRVLKVLDSLGVDTRKLLEFKEVNFSKTDDDSYMTSSGKHVELMGIVDTGYGKKLKFKLKTFVKNLYDVLREKGLSGKGIAFDGSDKTNLLNIVDVKLFDRSVEVLSELGVDVSPFNKFREKHFAQPTGTEKKVIKNYISYEDLGGDRLEIKIDYRLINQSVSDLSERDRIKRFIKEAVQYNFPQYQWQGDTFSYVVSGNYNQYFTFIKVLEKFSYEVGRIKAILESKIRSGSIKKLPDEGRYDDDQRFMGQIEDQFPESKFELYDQQKRGVAFLCGRSSAILGDSTGLGKTIQLIYAAAIETKGDPNKKVLIITMKAVMNQWRDEIINVLGSEFEDEVSLDPKNPKKWTVLSYHNFSAGKEVDENIEILKRSRFHVLILDELHKVKHGKSKTSINIEKVARTIPVRWGATATISANKPSDVRNQLYMIGHHIGLIKENKFKKDFAGFEFDGRHMTDKTTTPEQKVAAAERLNKWLAITGLYIRRTKEEVRDMPNIDIFDTSTTIDNDSYEGIFYDRLSRVKNPNLAITKLIVAREAIAQLKTTTTANKVLHLVRNNLDKAPAASKVVVFTNFKEAAKQLVNKISAGLRAINPKFHCLELLSRTRKDKRLTVKRDFTNDPNAKVLVMSMRMGGTGIDFPNAAQNMIINDFDWTPESAEQSEGRIYRINTNHNVNIEYVVSNGFDRDLFDLVSEKRKLAKIIQTLRVDYIDNDNQNALKGIIEKQKRVDEIDDKINDIAEKIASSGVKTESFVSYFSNCENIIQLI